MFSETDSKTNSKNTIKKYAQERKTQFPEMYPKGENTQNWKRNTFKTE